MKGLLKSMREKRAMTEYVFEIVNTESCLFRWEDQDDYGFPQCKFRELLQRSKPVITGTTCVGVTRSQCPLREYDKVTIKKKGGNWI